MMGKVLAAAALFCGLSVVYLAFYTYVPMVLQLIGPVFGTAVLHLLSYILNLQFKLKFHLAAVSLLTVVFLCAQFHFLSRLLSNLCPLSILQPLCVSLLSFSSASESGPSNTPSVPSSLISHPLLLHLMSSLVLLHWWIWHGAREMRVTAMCLLMAPCGDHYKLLQRADVLHRRYPISSNLSDGEIRPFSAKAQQRLTILRSKLEESLKHLDSDHTGSTLFDSGCEILSRIQLAHTLLKLKMHEDALQHITNALESLTSLSLAVQESILLSCTLPWPLSFLQCKSQLRSISSFIQERDQMLFEHTQPIERNLVVEDAIQMNNDEHFSMPERLRETHADVYNDSLSAYPSTHPLSMISLPELLHLPPRAYFAVARHDDTEHEREIRRDGFATRHNHNTTNGRHTLTPRGLATAADEVEYYLYRRRGRTKFCIDKINGADEATSIFAVLILLHRCRVYRDLEEYDSLACELSVCLQVIGALDVALGARDFIMVSPVQFYARFGLYHSFHFYELLSIITVVPLPLYLTFISIPAVGAQNCFVCKRAAVDGVGCRFSDYN